MKSGWTALMCAANGNHHAIVAELLAHGADTELGTAEVYIATSLYNSIILFYIVWTNSTHHCCQEQLS